MHASPEHYFTFALIRLAIQNTPLGLARLIYSSSLNRPKSENIFLSPGTRRTDHAYTMYCKALFQV